MPATDPLNLRPHLKQPFLSLDATPVLDVLLIGLMLLILGSRFVFAPGMTVDLELELPQTRQTAVPGVLTQDAVTVAVLTSRQDNMHLFGGKIYTMAGLEAAFREYTSRPANEGEDRVLLLKLDRRVSIDSFVRISDLARAAGFSSVQLGTEPIDRAAGLSLTPGE